MNETYTKFLNEAYRFCKDNQCFYSTIEILKIKRAMESNDNSKFRIEEIFKVFPILAEAQNLCHKEFVGMKEYYENLRKIEEDVIKFDMV